MEAEHYTATTEVDPETGDLILPFPDGLMEKMGWKVGDTLNWKEDNGVWIISKVEKEKPMEKDSKLTDLFKKVDRFDLEQDIMRAWSILDDIDLLHDRMYDVEMSEDDISNYLIGLRSIYHARFEKLFKTFEKLIENGNI